MADRPSITDGSSNGFDRRRTYRTRSGQGRGVTPRLLAMTLSLMLILASLPLTAGATAAAGDQATWTQLSPATSPTAREFPSMAFDPATGQMILFGGKISGLGYANDTWSWDGSTWHDVTPGSGNPPAREDASMAFDPATGELILFGGYDGSSALDDTWAWDGSTWTQRSPSTSPSARYGASMAFDPATGKLILFGGGGSGYHNDTWAWDGSNWTDASPASGNPPARDSASMAFDPASAQMILFGGKNGGGEFGDTWKWDGAAWTQLSPATSPAALDSASMDFDPATGQLVLVGGIGSGYQNGTWVWDGSTWTRLSPASSPTTRYGAGMAFDPATGQIILFGGWHAGYRDDTWAYAIPSFGTEWSQLDPHTSPSARSHPSAVFDPAIGKLVLFGGYGDSGILNDTWTWDGTTWVQLSPTASPPARYFASMDFDPATGQIILFGGNDGNGGNLNDTWAWDGTTWTQLSPSTSPPARYNASMAFDPANGEIILFGGYGDSGYLNDTWAWDGTIWTQLSPVTSPPALSKASMAFDPATGQLILFGGNDVRGNLNDTWVWDSTTWTQLFPSSNPSARYDATAAFDPATGQLILFGGFKTIRGYLNDTWAWDGTSWHDVSPNTSPSARHSAGLAFDPATGQLLLFGGFNNGWLGDTWELALVTDTTPPVTTATATNTDASSYSFGTWTNQDVTVSLSATDDLSGVASTSYTLDGGGTEAYSAPFTVTGEGDHTVTFWSVDTVGNTEPVQTVHVKIDTTVPTTIATAKNADNTTYTFGDWTNQNVTVTLSASDTGGSGVASTSYTLDGGSTQAYSAPFTVTGEGDHTITFWSVDTVGNTEPVQTVHVKIDTTVPTTIATAKNADNTTYTFGDWTNQSVTVTLSASDPSGSSVAGIYYQMDAGAQQTYTTPFVISAEGDHTVTFWSVDTAGNTETAQFVHVMIDLTGPTVTYVGNQGTYTVDQMVNITCTASDDLSGVASTTCADITGPAYSFGLGSHTFSATATDNVGNVGTGSTSFVVGVTPDSLCALTGQFVSTRRDASRLCSPLTGIKWAEAMGNQQLKASFVNTYIYLVNLQRGLSRQQKAILIQLAQAL